MRIQSAGDPAGDGPGPRQPARRATQPMTAARLGTFYAFPRRCAADRPELWPGRRRRGHRLPAL